MVGRRYAPEPAGVISQYWPDRSAQQFDPNVYHRMTTQFRGGGMCLDVFNGGRTAVHIITGGDDRELRADGSLIDHFHARPCQRA